MEWSQIKTFFNVPIKLVNLVSSFKTFVAEKKIPLKNIEIVLNILSQIQSHDEKSLHEAFYPLYNFLTAATSYYGIFAFEESPIAKIEEPMKNTQNLIDEKPETKTPVPMQYLELPRSKTDFIAHNSSKQSEPKVESVPAEPKQKQEIINNTQNNRNDAVKVDVFGKETVKISDILKNKESIRPSATTEMRSVSVKSASKSPVKRLPEQSEQKEVKRAVSTQRARDVQVKKETQKKKDIKELKERIKNTQEEEDFRERMLFDARGVEPSEAEVLISEIETKEIESRDYRHKVKKMLADHDRYVRRFIKDLGLNNTR